MTIALCLHCGEIKFGALCDCSHCHGKSSGNDQLDIAFTDWYYELDELDQFGDVIKEINSHCSDPEICHWAFMVYISENHPDTLSIGELEPTLEIEVRKVIAECSFGKVFPE